jgi:hypothetical protein
MILKHLVEIFTKINFQKIKNLQLSSTKLLELKINCSRILFNENIKGILFHKHTNIRNKFSSFMYPLNKISLLAIHLLLIYIFENYSEEFHFLKIIHKNFYISQFLITFCFILYLKYLLNNIHQFYS